MEYTKMMPKAFVLIAVATNLPGTKSSGFLQMSIDGFHAKPAPPDVPFFLPLPMVPMAGANH
eukprot:7967784-Heterocapsa_arctica.AAC.1